MVPHLQIKMIFCIQKSSQCHANNKSKQYQIRGASTFKIRPKLLIVFDNMNLNNIINLLGMAREFEQYRRQHPQNYHDLQSSIVSCFDQTKREHYSYSLARKQGGFFGSNQINLILKYPQNSLHEHDYVLFFQKILYLDESLNYSPTVLPNKVAKLIDIKMAARKGKTLTLAVNQSEKNNLEEWVIEFKSEKLAEKWEVTINDKKAEAKSLRDRNKHLKEQNRQLMMRVRTLEEQLSSSRNDYDNLLISNNILKQESKNYRQFTKKLEHTVFELRQGWDKCIRDKDQLLDINEKLKAEMIELQEKQVEQKKCFQCEIERLKVERESYGIITNINKQLMDLRYNFAKKEQQNQRLAKQLQDCREIKKKLGEYSSTQKCLLHKIIQRNGQIERMSIQLNRRSEIASTFLENEQDILRSVREQLI